MNNVDEYGQTLRANIGEDISTNIGLEFILEPKAGQSITRTQSEGVTVGTVNVTVGTKELMANEYLEYVVQPDDLDKQGQWRMKGLAKISATENKVGNFQRFTVLA